MSDWRLVFQALGPDLQSFIAPRFIARLYQAIRILSAFHAGMFGGFLFAFRGWIGDFLLVVGLLLIPVVWVVGCLLIRLSLEFFMVVFAIYDRTKAIARNTAPTDETEEGNE